MNQANHDKIVPHIDGLNVEHHSQGRISNISSSNKKPSLTERMNKGKLSSFVYFLERNMTGQASLAG